MLRARCLNVLALRALAKAPEAAREEAALVEDVTLENGRICEDAWEVVARLARQHLEAADRDGPHLAGRGQIGSGAVVLMRQLLGVGVAKLGRHHLGKLEAATVLASHLRLLREDPATDPVLLHILQQSVIGLRSQGTPHAQGPVVEAAERLARAMGSSTRQWQLPDLQQTPGNPAADSTTPFWVSPSAMSQALQLDVRSGCTHDIVMLPPPQGRGLAEALEQSLCVDSSTKLPVFGAHPSTSTVAGGGLEIPGRRANADLIRSRSCSPQHTRSSRSPSPHADVHAHVPALPLAVRPRSPLSHISCGQVSPPAFRPPPASIAATAVSSGLRAVASLPQPAAAAPPQVQDWRHRSRHCMLTQEPVSTYHSPPTPCVPPFPGAGVALPGPSEPLAATAVPPAFGSVASPECAPLFGTCAPFPEQEPSSLSLPGTPRVSPQCKFPVCSDSPPTASFTSLTGGSVGVPGRHGAVVRQLQLPPTPIQMPSTLNSTVRPLSGITPEEPLGIPVSSMSHACSPPQVSSATGAMADTANRFRIGASPISGELATPAPAQRFSSEPVAGVVGHHAAPEASLPPPYRRTQEPIAFGASSNALW